jgi:peptidyl-prolyl cis-trans isomerase SurA
VQEALYFQQLQPALRAYLTKARADAYIEIAPGFVDTGSSRKKTASQIAYTSYKAPPAQEEDSGQAAHGAGEAPIGPGRARRRPRTRRRKAGRRVAMAPTDSITSISTGTGYQTSEEENALAPKDASSGHKTRYTSRETQAEEQRAKVKLAKAEVKATDRPLPATPTQTETEKVQSSALGLNGDTGKKKKKHIKRQKGQPVERLQEKTKPVDNPTPIAPTVNPAIAGGSAPASTTPAPATTPQ